MNIRYKLALFFTMTFLTAILLYLRFAPNIQNFGLLNFIGFEMIIIVVVCHGLAFFARSFLVKRQGGAAGISLGNLTWATDSMITGEPLLTKVRKSYNKVAVLLFVGAAVATGLWISIAFNLKNLSDEGFGRHLILQVTYLVSFIASITMLLLAVHFMLMAFLLEYKSKLKSILVTVESFMMVFVIGAYF